MRQGELPYIRAVTVCVILSALLLGGRPAPAQHSYYTSVSTKNCKQVEVSKPEATGLGTCSRAGTTYLFIDQRMTRGHRFRLGAVLNLPRVSLWPNKHLDPSIN